MAHTPDGPGATSRRSLLAAFAGAPGAAALADAGGARATGDVGDAVDAARSHLLDLQQPYGDHWASNIAMGENGSWDARLTAYYALLLEHLDANEQSKQAAVDWLLDRRTPGGGWGDANANLAGLLLFRQLDGEYGDVVADVEAENEAEGFSLVERGRGFAEDLNTGTLRVKLLYLLVGDEFDRDELLPPRAPSRLLGLIRMTAAFEGGSLDPTAEFLHEPFINLMLGTGGLLAVTADEPTDATEVLRDLSTELLLGRRALNGTWGMSIEQLFATFALSGAGYDAGDPEISRALEYLAETWQLPSGRLVPFKLPVFDTGWALQALYQSGVSPDRDAMTDAAQYLFDARIANPTFKREDVPLDYPRPRPPFREKWGAGWGYRPFTESDWDDTAVALYGWGPYDERAVLGEIEFLLGVQRPSGAWGTWHATEMEALSEDDRQRILEEFGERFWENVSWLFSDPGVVDVTGHALVALGEHGYTVENSDAARRAVNWLRDVQGEAMERSGQAPEDGLWVTPRGPGYAYGTSRALLGMAAVDADMGRPEVEKAVDSLLGRQRPDGSWGEPRIAPVQTARILRALLAAGVPSDHRAVRRAVEFLVDAQRTDGSWESGRFMLTITGRPYSLSVFVQAEALMALVAYADAEGIAYEPARENTWFGLPTPDFFAWIAGLLALAGGLLALRRRD